MTSYSVLLPFLPRRPEQILPYAGLVHWSNASRLWQGQSVMIEPHQGFVAAAGAGFRVPTGLGVTLMPLRHPYEAALQARSLAMATGQPVIAGFGPGGRQLQQSLLGEAYRSPLTAAREYLSIVRGLLAGETVDTRGEYFSCRAEMPRYPVPGVEIGLGVLRPGMAKLAGEVADVAVTWLTPAHYLRDTVLPAMREGAANAVNAVKAADAVNAADGKGAGGAEPRGSPPSCRSPSPGPTANPPNWRSRATPPISRAPTTSTCCAGPERMLPVTTRRRTPRRSSTAGRSSAETRTNSSENWARSARQGWTRSS